MENLPEVLSGVHLRCWIVYPLDKVIRPLNNWGLVCTTVVDMSLSVSSSALAFSHNLKVCCFCPTVGTNKTGINACSFLVSCVYVAESSNKLRPGRVLSVRLR